MILAVGAMLVPALFFRVVQEAHQPELIHPVSVGTSAVLMLTYVLGLWFAFITHRKQMNAIAPVANGERLQVWSIPRAVALLLVASALMAVIAEELVQAVGEAGRAWGLNQVFLARSAVHTFRVAGRRAWRVDLRLPGHGWRDELV
jgi:Ca2+:H+ antiporter